MRHRAQIRELPVPVAPGTHGWADTGPPQALPPPLPPGPRPDPPDAPAGPYDRPGAPIRADHPALGPGAPLSPMATLPMPMGRPFALPSRPGAACPDACGTSCRYHGARNAKLARRAARSRVRQPARFDQTIEVQVPGTVGLTKFGGSSR